ncbi:MAG: GTP 3',8-cyclase MoaA [Anaerolineae bacterium]|nr:GTP 3',8-cyclase MoaA [Anaerolineae bacterium]
MDRYGRLIDYLRVSVTDRCNLRCIYCMPEEGVQLCSHDEILRYEEIVAVVRAAAELGISKIRLTGGEPLVRLGIVDLVRELAAVPGIEDLAMTTNGTLLARYAADLAEAGLRRVNISLDTLQPARFRAITRRGDLRDTLAGIDAANSAGLTPVKINTVVMRGVNDDEVVSLASKTVTDGWNLRFIEWMPVGGDALVHDDWRERVVTAAEIRVRVEAELGPLVPARDLVGAGPARTFRLADAGTAAGTLGFISAISEHFCDSCNRLRLTANGKLRPCLLSDYEIDLLDALRGSPETGKLQDLIRQAIQAKPQGHRLARGQRAQARVMAQIGG